MPRPFRFAVQLMQLAEPDEIASAAAAAESLGYAQLFSSDHLGAVDPFVPLMCASAAARAVEVGPLVLNNELHHPALLARTAATVDRMTVGRLVLGLGTGYAQLEHDAAGILLRHPGARVRRLDESLTVLRALLDTGSATFDGEFHHVAIDDLGVRPVRARVPFLIGGHGRRLVAVAARHADIFQYTGLVHEEGGAPTPAGFPIDQVRRRAAWLAEAAGDRLEEIERSALVQVVHVGADADGAAARLVERHGTTADVIEATPFVLIGSLQQVVDKVERLRDDVGISHFVVRDAENFAPVVAALRGR